MKFAVQMTLCLAVLMTAIPAAMACDGWRGGSETASNIEATPADTVPTNIVPTNAVPQADDQAAGVCGCSGSCQGDASACANAAESGVELTNTTSDADFSGCSRGQAAQTEVPGEDS